MLDPVEKPARGLARIVRALVPPVVSALTALAAVGLVPGGLARCVEALGPTLSALF